MQKKQLFRTVLVIGDNHKDIIKKYSLNTKVEPYILMKKSKAGIHKQEKIEFLSNIFKLDILNEKQKDLLNEHISTLKEMSDLEYFLEKTEGCEYDKKTGDAYTTKNPLAYYQNERTPQDTFEKNGEESGFCSPFKLKDDYISYSAINEDIDWSLNHLVNQSVYKSAWELVVDNRTPINEQEKQIKERMKNRKEYFNNFDSKEDYINYSTSFWTYGVATKDSYVEIGMDGNTDKKWINEFYDRFIKKLPKDTLLTLYEVQNI